ncbi:MAG TPA: D-tyrosyl-tRNA(Tyr) deacylase [Dysgonomonas sp.]|nr:D-tyrosyl-tRNA(Tyr) deacylase [Dysgonomonas sp.]
MRVVLQRVKSASVTIDNIVKSKIERGILILLGIEDSDDEKDIEWLCTKIINLRVFDDENGVMNLSVKDINAEILVVSQFTLFASTKKGNRPSYLRASKPDIAIPLYEKFCDHIGKLINKPVATGSFGANMSVQLINDGPVTIIIDSKLRE